MLLLTPLKAHILQYGICRRTFSSQTLHVLDNWIATPKIYEMERTLAIDRIRDLHTTLPTRAESSVEPGGELGYGHHLAVFNLRHREEELRADGTENDFSPPGVNSRRMWVGGTMTWNGERPLRIGDTVKLTTAVGPHSVQKKGFDKNSPMLFVTQDMKYRLTGLSTGPELSLHESRTHVYVFDQDKPTKTTRVPKAVQGLPALTDIATTFSFVPTPTTLFRFSALTFNSHRIHLDKEYSNKEGYPERLVHGPLSALMFLEVFKQHERDAKILSFTYRAVNPIPLGGRLTTYVSKPKPLPEGNLLESFVWNTNEEGTVGMTGAIRWLPS